MISSLLLKIASIATVVIILLALALGIGMQLTDGELFSRLGMVRHTATRQSEVLYEEARDLYQLVTAELVVKAVFPHDFIPGGYSLERILARVRAADAPLSDVLTRRERSYLELYNIGLESGLSIQPDSRDFLVFTAILSAGYDLEPLDQTDSPAQLVRIDDSTSPPRVDLVMPAPVILDVRLQDPTEETYQYPDIPITPAQLRRISDYVRTELRQHPDVQQLLDTAHTNGSNFVQQTLQAAGYGTVRLLTQEELNGGSDE